MRRKRPTHFWHGRTVHEPAEAALRQTQGCDGSNRGGRHAGLQCSAVKEHATTQPHKQTMRRSSLSGPLLMYSQSAMVMIGHTFSDNNGAKQIINKEAINNMTKRTCKQEGWCREMKLYMWIYYVDTHNHSVSVANWCLNSHLSSHHCLYRDRPHTVHWHLDGKKRGEERKQRVRLHWYNRTFQNLNDRAPLI